MADLLAQVDVHLGSAVDRRAGGQQQLADIVGCDCYPRTLVGNIGEALAMPAGEVGDEDVRLAAEVEFGLEEKEPLAWAILAALKGTDEERAEVQSAVPKQALDRPRSLT